MRTAGKEARAEVAEEERKREEWRRVVEVEKEEDRTQTTARRELVERALLSSSSTSAASSSASSFSSSTFAARRLWFRNTRLSRSPPLSSPTDVRATRFTQRPWYASFQESKNPRLVSYRGRKRRRRLERYTRIYSRPTGNYRIGSQIAKSFSSDRRFPPRARQTRERNPLRSRRKRTVVHARVEEETDEATCSQGYSTATGAPCAPFRSFPGFPARNGSEESGSRTASRRIES